MNNYHIEPETSKPNSPWLVVNKDGYIANCKRHKTELEAQRHCDNLNSFCYGDK